MTCPNCSSTLNEVIVDGISVDHCPECGGSFFDDNEINRVSVKAAQILAFQKAVDALSSEEKICPKDGQVMARLNTESVPRHITLLTCPKCHGIFAYPQDLVSFKQAQQAKIDFFKKWRIPLPSLQSILVYTSFIIISLSTIALTYFVTNRSQIIQSNAAEVCKPHQIVKTESGYLFYCQTDSLFVSELKIVCSDGEKILPVNKNPSVNHMVTIPLNCQYSQLILYQDKLKIETELFRLE